VLFRATLAVFSPKLATGPKRAPEPTDGRGDCVISFRASAAQNLENELSDFAGSFVFKDLTTNFGLSHLWAARITN